MNHKTCAFTGHRPQKFPWRYDETSEACLALKEVLNSEIKRLADAGVTDFLSGMAEGVDTWAALDVLALRDKNPHLRLHCILPCRTQAEKWNADAQKRYRSILEQADSVIYVNRDYCRTCMLERDRFLVSHANILLAVYNGSPRSGTAATVRFAQAQNRELWIIDPSSLQITRTGRQGDR